MQSNRHNALVFMLKKKEMGMWFMCLFLVTKGHPTNH